MWVDLVLYEAASGTGEKHSQENEVLVAGLVPTS